MADAMAFPALPGGIGGVDLDQASALGLEFVGKKAFEPDVLEDGSVESGLPAQVPARPVDRAFGRGRHVGDPEVFDTDGSEFLYDGPRRFMRCRRSSLRSSSNGTELRVPFERALGLAPPRSMPTALCRHGRSSISILQQKETCQPSVVPETVTWRMSGANGFPLPSKPAFCAGRGRVRRKRTSPILAA